MNADLGEILVILNLIALVVFLVTLHIGRIQRCADWLVDRLHKLRGFTHKSAK